MCGTSCEMLETNKWMRAWWRQAIKESDRLVWNANSRTDDSEMTQLKMDTSRCETNFQQSVMCKTRRRAWGAKEMEQKVIKAPQMTQEDILKCN